MAAAETVALARIRRDDRVCVADWLVDSLVGWEGAADSLVDTGDADWLVDAGATDWLADTGAAD